MRLVPLYAFGHFRAMDAANKFDSLVYAVVSCSNWGFGGAVYRLNPAVDP
jgi:hypothetical protein